MKAYANTLLYILLMIDFSMFIAITGFGVELEALYFIILVVNLVLGPIQFFPALFVMNKEKYNNIWMTYYYIASIVLIALTLYIAFFSNHEVYDNKEIFASIMVMCYGLGHAYAPIIAYGHKKK